MLIRIVKMGFKPDEIENFQNIFSANRHKIKGFDGCHHVELLRDVNNKTRFFTYSHWENETALEKYRHSEVFKGIWSETKKLFTEKPEAWSVEKQEF